jgi:hypothetical protein
MTEAFAIALSFPTVFLTVPLGVVLLYWLLVVAGAFDLPTHGAHDGIGLDGHGASHGGGHHHGLDGAEGLAALLSALKLRSAPVTVVLSLLVLVAWLLCAGAMPVVLRLGGGPPGWLAGLGLLLGALLLALPLTSLLVRPLGDLFVVHEARRHKDLLGHECVVETGRADKGFGQARLEDGGAGLILQIRCDTDGGLRRGDRALLLYWDEARQAYVAERMDRAEGARPRDRVAADVKVPSGEAPEEVERKADAQAARKEQG